MDALAGKAARAAEGLLQAQRRIEETTQTTQERIAIVDSGVKAEAPPIAATREHGPPPEDGYWSIPRDCFCVAWCGYAAIFLELLLRTPRKASSHAESKRAAQQELFGMKVLLHTMYDTVLTSGNWLGDPILERALKHEAAEALCGDDYPTQSRFPFYAVAFGARIAVKALEATDDHWVAFGPPQ